MKLADLVSSIADFKNFSTRDTIRFFVWYMHTYEAREAIDNDSLRNCFRQLHMTLPDVSVYLPRMAKYKPPDLIKVRGGYKLERSVRTVLDSKYGVSESVVRVSSLLADLPSKLPDLAERTFLVEALKCYRVEAYRACVVMTWNLAFDHLLRWTLANPARLSAFNGAIGKRYPKKAGLSVAALEHFEELKESETIEICQTAAIFSKNTADILREKLKRRNIAAHPSQVMISQHQADDVITDLINNILIALKN